MRSSQEHKSALRPTFFKSLEGARRSSEEAKAQFCLQEDWSQARGLVDQVPHILWASMPTLPSPFLRGCSFSPLSPAPVPLESRNMGWSLDALLD